MDVDLSVVVSIDVINQQLNVMDVACGSNLLEGLSQHLCRDHLESHSFAFIVKPGGVSDRLLFLVNLASVRAEGLEGDCDDLFLLWSELASEETTSRHVALRPLVHRDDCSYGTAEI
eukprot:CAMPEP_0197649092 /NCGR_PEP_ID=MMETSP1338-20131121/28148_1 /TAXON_ID=43686 ORGANISM="Pelagodinium beii, Strain RCC1491" /NCGR_SAMPLE_ID=MMETSP1338 /ASSEMBLY_ACC=CAM_ASM_000754 /LENGTH=116 /DNA_ID=CAMNT_0043223207 /DNA_START=316 /DNA_END=666 /DNA_ORIENTATION=+